MRIGFSQNKTSNKYRETQRGPRGMTKICIGRVCRCQLWMCKWRGQRCWWRRL